MSIYHCTESTFSKEKFALTPAVKQVAKESPKAQKAKVSDKGWNIDELHPSEWFRVSTGTQDRIGTVAGTLLKAGIESFTWIDPKCGIRRKGKYQPYCYETLCSIILPNFFGIYQYNGKIVQLDLMAFRKERVIKMRNLNPQQLRSYVFRQIARVEALLGEEEAVRTVFNTEMLNASGNRKEGFLIQLNQTEINHFLPEFPRKEGKVKVNLVQFLHTGEAVIEPVFAEVDWTSDPNANTAVQWLLGMVGQTFPMDLFHAEMDAIGYEVGNNRGRVQKLNKLLMQEGMVISRKMAKSPGQSKRTWHYQVLANTVKPFTWLG